MSPTDAPIPPEFNAAEFARRWKDLWQGDVERLEERAEQQKLLVEKAPEAWLRALMRELAPATLWGFLNPKNKGDFDPLRVDARQVALRGFQQTQSIVRQPTVQNRLVAWVGNHREVAHLFLLLWQQKNTEVVRALDEDADEATLLRAIKQYGPLSVWLGATYIGSQRVFGKVESLLSVPETWDSPKKTRLH